MRETLNFGTIGQQRSYIAAAISLRLHGQKCQTILKPQSSWSKSPEKLFTRPSRIYISSRGSSALFSAPSSHSPLLKFIAICLLSRGCISNNGAEVVGDI